MRKGLIIILSIFFVITGITISAQKEKISKNNLTSDKIKTNKQCSFDLFGLLFPGYAKFYPELYYADHRVEDWVPYLRGKYKCEDVLKFVMDKEKVRLTKKLDVIVPSEGINTGILIAYGCYIPPPYNIKADLENLTLSVNNVQIWRLIRPSEVEMSEYEKYEKEIIDIRRKIIALDELLKKKYIESENRWIKWSLKFNGKEATLLKLKDALEYVKNIGYLKDYKIYDEEKLLFDVLFSDYSSWDIPEEYQPEKKEEKVEQEVPEGFKPYVPLSAEERKKVFQEFIQGEKQFLSQDLKNNDVVFYSATYSDFTPYRTLSNKQILQICKTIISEIHDIQKIYDIGNIVKKETDAVGNYRAGKEIFFNLSKENCLVIINKVEGIIQDKEK